MMGRYATHSGRLIDINNFTEEDIDIYDIAHHLAKIQRFNGAAPIHISYTVGEHCINLSRYFKDMNYMKSVQFAALMHDASKTYIHNTTNPLKRNLSDYLEIEQRIQGIIDKKFNIKYPKSDFLLEADERILMNEVLAIMPDKYSLYKAETSLEPLYEDFPMNLVPYQVECNNHPSTTNMCFLTLFKELYDGNE